MQVSWSTFALVLFPGLSRAEICAFFLNCLCLKVYTEHRLNRAVLAYTRRSLSNSYEPTGLKGAGLLEPVILNM